MPPTGQIPPNVHVKDGRYYLVNSIGDGKRRWLGLSRVSDGPERLLDALRSLENGAVITIGDLLRAYTKGGMSELRPATRKGYALMCAKDSPLQWTFGTVKIEKLRTVDVARYLEKRKIAGRSHGGNRERAVLSAAYEYGMRNGYATSNPCRGVRRNRERPRTRYITTEELQAAMDKSPPQFQELLAAAYLTGLRQADLLAMRLADLRKDGIYVTESKTGRARVIEWSSELRKVIEIALDRGRLTSERLEHPAPTHVFTGRYAAPWGSWAVQSQMRRLKVEWHFHDLRAKAATDAKHSVLGKHSTLGTYLRGERTKPVV